MSFVNRKLYKQKPQAWGPVSSVQASIFKNSERIGIPPPVSFIPTWERTGDYVYDYLCNKQSNTITGDWKNDSLIEAGDNRVNVVIASALNQGAAGSKPFSVEINGVIASRYLDIYLFAMRSGSTQYTWIYYQYNTEKFYFRSLNGVLETTGTYGNNTDDFPATHFVFVFDTPNSKIYIYADGKLLEIVIGTCQWPAGNANIYYGGPSESQGIIKQLNYGKLFYDVVLSSDQVAYLNDNPYSLLHRVPHVFYSVPGGGVLPTFNPLFLNAAQPTRVIQ